MSLISAPASVRRQRGRRTALLASGHRLMFLAAGTYGVIPMLAWVATLRGHAAFTPAWHGHEMLFGFAVAGIGGFLTAAVPKWTGTGPFAGGAAALLFGLWLAGRVAMWTGILPWVDVLLLAALTAMVGARILGARNRRNYQVVGMLTLLFAADVAWHLGHRAAAVRGGIYVVAALVALIGGRVVPIFTANRIRLAGEDPAVVRRVALLDRRAVPVVLLAGALMLAAPASPVTAGVWIAAAVAMAVRSLRWGMWSGRRWPIVLVMHVAWWFLPAGLLLGGLASLGAGPGPAAALHALTGGAIGGMLIAIASRAARGHSGRPLGTSWWTRLSYLLVLGGALWRVAAPPGLIAVAGELWSLGWLIFVIEHAPMLVMARLDGRPG